MKKTGNFNQALLLSFIFHLCFCFPSDPGSAVHDTGPGNLVVSVLQTDGIQCCIQILLALLLVSILKKGQLFKGIIRKTGQ